MQPPALSHQVCDGANATSEAGDEDREAIAAEEEDFSPQEEADTADATRAPPPRTTRTLVFRRPNTSAVDFGSNSSLLEAWTIPPALEKEARRTGSEAGEIWINDLCDLAGAAMVEWALYGADNIPGDSPRRVCDLVKERGIFDDEVQKLQKLLSTLTEDVQLRFRRRFLNLALIFTVFMRRFLWKTVRTYDLFTKAAAQKPLQKNPLRRVLHIPFFRQYLDRYDLTTERDVERADIVSMATTFQARDLPIVAAVLVFEPQNNVQLQQDEQVSIIRFRDVHTQLWSPIFHVLLSPLPTTLSLTTLSLYVNLPTYFSVMTAYITVCEKIRRTRSLYSEIRHEMRETQNREKDPPRWKMR